MDENATAENEVPNGPPLKILLIEDNADAREMLETLLQLEGYDVGVAEDGRAGLDAILTQRPEVALIDIGLPGLDGYEVARRAREELPPQELYLLALTGYGQSRDQRRALEAGFDAHLSKPVDVKS